MSESRSLGWVVLATDNVAAKRETWFVNFIILGDNLRFYLNAAWLPLLQIKEDTFEGVCWNKAAFVLYDPFRNILSYCLT